MRTPSIRAIVFAAVAVGATAACTGEDAVPIDELPADQLPAETGPAVTHTLEPTDQMRDLATQQCLDDPDLDAGYIQAVDPDDPDQILSSITVDCDEVR